MFCMRLCFCSVNIRMLTQVDSLNTLADVMAILRDVRERESSIDADIVPMLDMCARARCAARRFPYGRPVRHMRIPMRARRFAFPVWARPVRRVQPACVT